MDIARFSTAVADPNRAHIEDGAARIFGFDTVFASGGLLVGVMNDMVTAWAGLSSLRRSRCSLVAPLFPGAIVTITGKVTGREDSETLVALDVQVAAADDSGKLGEATYMIEIATQR
jgi:acyl dehydratase